MSIGLFAWKRRNLNIDNGRYYIVYTYIELIEDVISPYIENEILSAFYFYFFWWSVIVSFFLVDCDNGRGYLLPQSFVVIYQFLQNLMSFGKIFFDHPTSNG